MANTAGAREHILRVFIAKAMQCTYNYIVRARGLNVNISSKEKYCGKSVTLSFRFLCMSCGYFLFLYNTVLPIFTFPLYGIHMQLHKSLYE